MYARPDEPGWGFQPDITHDGRHLVITVTHGTHREARIHVVPVEGGNVGEVAALVDDGAAGETVLGVLDGRFVVLTDRDAERRRVVVIDPDDPRPDTWLGLVPQSDDALVAATLVGGADDDRAWLVCSWLRHATGHVPCTTPATERSCTPSSYPFRAR